MSFTLRLHFSGLCLFVPEPVGGGPSGRMHVLMPSMVGDQHDPADRHVPVIAYDAGYLAPDGQLLGVSALARLTGHTFVPVAGAEAELRLCSQIVDLRAVTGRSVDPDHLADDTQYKLASRVTLGAGRITRVSPGLCWEWGPGELRPIAYRVEWVIPDVEGDRFTLVSEPIGGGGVPRHMGTLFPVNGALNLEVLHETPQDLPPDPLPVEFQSPPMPGESPRHFAAYYSLFGGPVPIRMPRYWGSLADCPPLPGGCETIPPGMGGMPFNSLVAGVGP
jgi:hypothetical protein